jgi:hypothetical protein
LLTETDIDLRVAEGDIAAHIYKAERLFRRNTQVDDAEAERLIEEALLRGNAFAPQVLARARAVRNQTPAMEYPGGHDEQSSIDVIEPILLASLMGDYRVSSTIEDSTFSGPGAMIIARAMRVANVRLARLNAERARRGWPPLEIAPRPGADAWRLALDNGGVLTIWPR